MNVAQSPTTITAATGTPFLDVEREFAAPVAALFRAYTDPVLVAQWLGPARNEMRVEHWDAVTGGGYRYVHVTPDGAEQIFRGIFHTIDPDERIIQTFEWAGAPNQVSLESVEFIGLDGARTRMRAHAVFPSNEALEQAMSYGMADGMTESYDRLATLLAS